MVSPAWALKEPEPNSFSSSLVCLSLGGWLVGVVERIMPCDSDGLKRTCTHPLITAVMAVRVWALSFSEFSDGCSSAGALIPLVILELR